MLIYHVFADHGIEAEVLSQHGRVVRVGLSPDDGFGEAVQADATSCPLRPGADLAVLHPPCTRWSDMTSLDGNAGDHPNLIPDARELGGELADHYVIENKPQAPLENPTVLKGQMFGLPINYARAFEASFPIPEPPMQPRLGGPETNPYHYASHTKEWWAAAKGYRNDYAKQAIAKNCVPAAFMHHIVRAWYAATGRGQVRDYSRYDTLEYESREKTRRRESENEALAGFALDADRRGGAE